jgi:hypothetical protein
MCDFMAYKKISYNEMIEEVAGTNTKYLYKRLEEAGKTEVIRAIYDSHMNGDDRITRSDNIYLLFNDISKSDIDTFSKEVDRFLKDRSLWVATVYMLDDYTDSLDRAYKSDNNTHERMAISELKARLISYKDGAINNMERSVVMSLSETERETLYKYAEYRMASE